MARWSSLLSKVWIHSALVHLPLEVEGHSERAAQSLLALRSSGHPIPLWMKKRREKQGSMPIFLNIFSGLSYNGDIQLLWKTSSNYYFLSSIIIIRLTTFKWWVLHAGIHKNILATALSQGRSGSAFQIALQIQYAHAQHSYSVCHKYFPASLALR